MKKNINILLSIFLVIFVFGCSKNTTTTKNILEETKNNYIEQIISEVDFSIFDEEAILLINNYISLSTNELSNASSLEEMEVIFNNFLSNYNSVKDKNFTTIYENSLKYINYFYSNNINNYNIKRQEEIFLTIEKYKEDISKLTRSDEVTKKMNETLAYFETLPTLKEEKSIGFNGDFIQPTTVANYTVNQFKTILTNMKKVGITDVLIQWTYDSTPGNSVLYYDSDIFVATKKYPNMLDNLLNAASSLDMRVFVGLNLTDEWWNAQNAINNNWLVEQGNIGARQAEELYNKYYSKYPNTFYAWYFALEYYCMSKTNIQIQLNQPINQQQYEHLNSQWANLMNIYLDKFTSLEKNLPMLFSPYYSSWLGGTKQDTYEQWSYFVKNTRFRKGDILAPQDSFGGKSVGPNEEEYNSAKEYLTGMFEASKDNENLEFWINIETFAEGLTRESMERVKTQIELAKTMTDNLICFSYFHYYLPDTAGTTSYQEQYIKLLKELYQTK